MQTPKAKNLDYALSSGSFVSGNWVKECFLWFICLIVMGQFHPQRPRGSQSGWEKRCNERFQAQIKKAPNLTGPFPNGQVDAGSWLGAKNALYFCAQSANSISWVLFVCMYTMAIVSPRLCLQGKLSNQKRRTYWWVEKTLHATNSSISICTEKILLLTNNKGL